MQEEEFDGWAAHHFPAERAPRRPILAAGPIPRLQARNVERSVSTWRHPNFAYGSSADYALSAHGEFCGGVGVAGVGRAFDLVAGFVDVILNEDISNQVKARRDRVVQRLQRRGVCHQRWRRLARARRNARCRLNTLNGGHGGDSVKRDGPVAELFSCIRVPDLHRSRLPRILAMSCLNHLILEIQQHRTRAVRKGNLAEGWREMAKTGKEL